MVGKWTLIWEDNPALAHGAETVLGLMPRRALKKSSVARFRLWPHWNTATYCARYHLLTPRKRLGKIRSPVHRPSRVLQCTSRTPRRPGPAPRCPSGLSGPPPDGHGDASRPPRLYPFHSSVSTVVPSRHVSS